MGVALGLGLGEGVGMDASSAALTFCVAEAAKIRMVIAAERRLFNFDCVPIGVPLITLGVIQGNRKPKV